MPDFDFDSVDGIDDADDDAVFVLIKADGVYGWHWVSREACADADRYDLARYGMPEDA